MPVLTFTPREILIKDIIKLMQEEKAKTSDPDKSLISFATKLGNAIDRYAGGGESDGQVSSIEEQLNNHLNNINNPHQVTKDQVGLSEVDNTSDINKPVSTAQAAADQVILGAANLYTDNEILEVMLALEGKQDALGYVPENIANKNIAGGYAGLGLDGKIFSSQLPSLVVTDTFVVNSEAEMLALVAETGDVAVRTDLNKTFILKGNNPATLSHWQEFLSPTSAVTSVFGRVGPVVANVGDYNADQITETGNRKFQTLNQFTFNDATSSIQTQLNNKETAFSKNTAFNKNFGTVAGTVAEGNDSRINNGQTAYSWGNHALAGYVHSSEVSVNPIDNTIVRRSGSGLALISGGYLETTLINVDATAITEFATFGGGGVIRKNSIGAVKNILGLGNYSQADFVKQSFVNSGNWNVFGAADAYSALVARVESGAINPPTDNVWNWSLYQQGDTYRGSQIAVTAYNQNRMFFRGSNGETGAYYPWNEVIHNNNYNSYSPTLTGGNASGTWNININGGSGSANLLNPLNGDYNYKLGFSANNTRDNAGEWGRVVMRYEPNGQTYGVRVDRADYADNSNLLDGLDSSAFFYYRGNSSPTDFQNFQSAGGVTRFDQVTAIQDGGWSNQPPGVYGYGGVLSYRGDNFGLQIYGSHTGDLVFKTQWNNDQYSGWRNILHSSNYMNYSPTLTGGGASGTWSINITGGSGTAANISNNGTVTLATPVENNAIYVTQPSYTTDKPVKQLNFQWYGDVWSLSNIRSSSSFSNGFGVYLNDVEKFRFVPTGFLINGNTALHSGNYNSYSPTLTGGNASGTWGISITGNAYSASYVTGYQDIAANRLYDHYTGGAMYAYNGRIYNGWLNDSVAVNNAKFLSTNYDSGTFNNPQQYFNNNTGVKVAMTGASTGLSYWSDTLWINGYNGGDVPSMCALHFSRGGEPRMAITTQAHTSTSYGTSYEVLTDYNYMSRQYFTSGLSVGSASVRTGNLANVNSIAIGDSDTGFRQNGDGILETWCNNVLVKHQTSSATNIYQPLYLWGELTVGNGAGSSMINMYDGDEGNRQIHCNSNRIGFLTQSGNWGSWCNDDGSWTSDVNIFSNGHVSAAINMYAGGFVRARGGVTGDYDQTGTADKIIWTIGESWASLGSMYGLAYEYGGGTISGIQNTHQVTFKNAGTTNARISLSTGTAWFNGNIYSSADIIAYTSSDMRLKDNIKRITNPLEKLFMLNGYTFNWNDKQTSYIGNDIGIIAQEVEQVLPEIVTTRKTGYKAVKYDRLIPLLIECIKDQQKQIEQLYKLLK